LVRFGIGFSRALSNNCSDGLFERCLAHERVGVGLTVRNVVRFDDGTRTKPPYLEPIVAKDLETRATRAPKIFGGKGPAWKFSTVCDAWVHDEEVEMTLKLRM